MSDRLPVLADFTQSEIDATVNQQVRNDPITLSLGVVGVGAGALSFAWGGLEAPLLLWLFAGLSSVSAGGKYAVDRTTRRAELVRRLVMQRRAWLDGEVDRLATRLRTEFTARDLVAPLRQLDELETSYGDLRDLLDSRFSDRGLSKDRFVGNAQQLREQALERLSLIIDELDAVDSIPVNDLNARLEAGGLSEVEDRSIRERLGHYDNAQATIQTYQDDVEAALARISHISTQIPKIGADNASFKRYLAEMERYADGVSAFDREV